jgi:hypothetical protein
VREYRTQGSVRGLPGNRQSYLDVRRAQLGASCGVPRTLSFPGSPHRAKPDQQPVPSVAPVAESFKSGTGRTKQVKRTQGTL